MLPELMGQSIEVRILEMVFPDQTNHYGTLFGGHALALMDKAAFIAASRYSRRTVVTARSEQIDFRSPVRQGQLIELIGRVVATGRSSMTVAVDLYAEDLLSGERQLCTRALRHDRAGCRTQAGGGADAGYICVECTSSSCGSSAVAIERPR